MGQDISWLGNDYQDVPWIQLPKTGGGTALFHDTTVATAEAADVLSGKTFFGANGLETGTGSGGGGTTTLIPYGIRPDAEVIKTYTFDQLLVEDLEIDIPAYSTTAKTLLASGNLSPTISVDLAAYDYRFVQRQLAYPIYAEGTAIATGRVDHWMGVMMHDLVTIPGGTIKSFDGNTYTSRTTTFYQSGGFGREVYYSSASAITVYTTSAYGIYETSTQPSISGSTVTVKSPALGIRGHATYLRSSVWGTIADIRYQYVIDVIRAPKGNLNLDGWGSYQAALHIIDCVQNNQGVLT